MPRLVFTRDALSDIRRLHEFLAAKNEAAAQRASAAIAAALKAIERAPQAHRLLENRPNERERIIRFGASGYVVRYRHEHGGDDVVVLRIWHQREDRG
jgi:plasmid stabilization system protein ParE